MNKQIVYKLKIKTKLEIKIQNTKFIVYKYLSLRAKNVTKDFKTEILNL